MKMARWIFLLLLALLTGTFAYLNTGERITLDFGFAVLYRISLAGALFGSFLLGMVSMFLLGLRHDMRVRRALREHRPSALSLDQPRYEDLPG